MLLCLLCTVLNAAPAPKAKGKPPPPPALVSPLDAVKLGDYVEYEFHVDREGPTRLRAQATERVGTRLAVDVREVGGASRRWLAPGVRLWLETAGKRPENVFSMEDRLATTTGTPVEALREGQVFACERIEFNESRGDGPRGSLCFRSKDPRLALGNGLVELHQRSSGFGGGGGFDLVLVSAGNAPVGPAAADAWPEGGSWTKWTARSAQSRTNRERNAVTSRGGRIVNVITRWEEALDDDRVDAKFDGTAWMEITTDEWADDLPRALLGLVGARYQAQLPQGAKPGPVFKAGPVPVETLVFEENGARLTVVAKPESAPQLPLDLRYGVLRREVLGAGSGARAFEVIEWK